MSTKFKNGLVLGKFMPVQTGHVFLINSAAEQCETTHVMICSDKTQPIDGGLRYLWLCNIFKDRPEINIIWCTDENPQYPNEAMSTKSFYEDFWVPTIYKYIKELDVVFTSEDYGDEFAEYLGIKHILVDKARNKFAISATAIREYPFEHWNFIPDVVKPYFMKKVAILGPESTGKSILTERLAKYFKCDFVDEFGRTYTAEHGTKNLVVEDFEAIATKHFINVLEKSRSTNKLLISDTEAITTKIFGEMYVDNFKSNLIDNFIKLQKFDLYLLMDIDVPWVNDGTRDFPSQREEHLSSIKKELNERKIPYLLISGDYDQRFRRAIKEIEKWGYLLTEPV